MKQIKFSDLTNGDILQSFKDYAVEFENETILDYVKHTLGTYFQKVSSTVGILNYKNYVGISHISDKEIRVVSDKISPELYELMIKEVIEKIAQLPFDFNSPTHEYFEIRDYQTDKHVLYHLYLIIVYIFFDSDVNLQSALESIVRNPARKNIYYSKRTDIWNIDKVSTQVFNSIIHNPESFERIPSQNNINKTMLARKIKEKSGKSHFPVYADSTELDNSFDTIENRFVKQFLVQARDVIEEFLSVIKPRKGILNKGVLMDNCNYILNALEEWLLHDNFIDVGEMDQLPFNSIILHQRDGYKEVFQFYNMINSTLQLPLSFQQVATIIENKDIAELYEIWTYFKTLNVVEETFHVTPETAIVVRSDEVRTYLKNSMNVTYQLGKESLKVWYNKTYSKGKESYSLNLRPDIVIEFKGKRYIFDAKFKLESFNRNSEQELDGEPSFTFKNSDIYKMHTYKDAISGVCTACILYPNESTSSIQFFRDGIQGKGVGAIPLLPKSNIDNFKLFLKQIII